MAYIVLNVIQFISWVFINYYGFSDHSIYFLSDSVAKKFKNQQFIHTTNLEAECE